MRMVLRVANGVANGVMKGLGSRAEANCSLGV